MGFIGEQWNHIRGNVKWDVIKWTGAVVITAAAYLLHKIGHLPDWTFAAGIFIAALFVFIVVASTKKVQPQERPQAQTQAAAPQVVIQAVGLEPAIAEFERMYRINGGLMLQEAEAVFRRLAAHFPNPADRENFLIRALTGGTVVVLHNEVWWIIWRSQIELLQELNTRPLSVDETRRHYDAAAKAWPLTYKNYSFEQWLNYLRSKNLIIQTDIVNITLRGKDFLRFMVQEGWSANSKFN